MDYAALTDRYTVRPMTEADLPGMLELCRGNPTYYQYCPPEPSAESLRADLAALPPRMTPKDKHFLGFFDGPELVALLDLITGYPAPDIAFWGFFMLRADWQGRGLGSALVTELCAALKAMGFRAVRLGWVSANPQASRFWKKNGFLETGATWTTEDYTVTVGQRELT